jgi:DNA repair exonuclease SbcCD ATPase subunit
MKIKSVEFRNFASYGNKIQKIEFEENVGNFYLILGQNGAGKSTISDVIKFALYGKLQNKNLKDIPNRFNSNAWCKIVLEKDARTEVVIERSINPSNLKCTVNGMVYDQAGKSNVQAFIEEDVIGLPFYVFNNIISLSINDFKSFLNMSSRDKRAIIDKIFSLEIINRIRWQVKEESKKIRDSIMLLDNEVNILENSIKTSETELEKLLQKITTSNEELKIELQNKIKDLNEKLITVDEHSKDILGKEQKLKDKRTDLQNLKADYTLTVKQANEKEKLYNNDQCPICESNLHTEEHTNILVEWKGKKEFALDEIKKLDTEFDKLTTLSQKITVNKQKLLEHKTKIQTHITYNTSELKKISTENDPAQTESLKNIIESAAKKKDNAKKNKSNTERKGNFYKILEEVFGDKGVKQLAIKRILPSLNAEINRVIKELNMEYRVTFTDEFEAIIMHLGYPVSSQMLSTGERKKVDFAVLISLIKLMKIKFHGMNLIFLDEIFSSIDSDGIYQILKILSNTCKELNLNTFVINHSPLPVEIFDYKMEIIKNNGFSNFEIEKIQ